jgi:hypothetical protein
MITFKQFLLEGGAATASAGTVRATKRDIEIAVQFVSDATGIPASEITANLLGSTPNTLAGLKADSGDLDIAVDEQKYDREKVTAAMAKAVGAAPVKIVGSTYSYPVPTYGGRKVQVDLMFFPSVEWARWFHHSDPKSQHKGVVRNQLLIATAINAQDLGKDLIVKDSSGNVVVKVRRALKSDEGLVRQHKVAALRKDGKGRTKSLVAATEKDIKLALKELGMEGAKFSMEKEQLLDPDAVAQKLFGKGTKAKDLMSAEQVAKKILTLKNAKDIVQTALNGLTLDQLPKELRHLVG